MPAHAASSPPRDPAYLQRKSSMDGNQMRNENALDFPYKVRCGEAMAPNSDYNVLQDYYNTFTSRRPVMRSQPDRRHAYREGRTAMQQHQRQVRRRLSSCYLALTHVLFSLPPATPTHRIRGTK